MSPDPVEYRLPDTPPPSQGRPLGKWIALLLIWFVGLIVWIFYLVLAAVVIFRIL